MTSNDRVVIATLRKQHDWTGGGRDGWAKKTGGWMVGQMKRKMDEQMAEWSAR